MFVFGASCFSSVGEYILLCKGAEVAILDRVISGDIEGTQSLINDYAVVSVVFYFCCYMFLLLYLVNKKNR